MKKTVHELLDGLDDVKDRIDNMDEKIREDFTIVLNGAVSPLQMKDEALEASIEALKLEVQEKDDTHHAEIEALKVEIQELKTELVLCKTSIANSVTPNGALAIQAAPKIKVPEPKEFKGERSAVEVDNFLWSMEQYFDAVGIKDESAKVRTASMYLIDGARLWLRFVSDEGRKGTMDPIATWDDFVKAFREYFYPEYAPQEARTKLHRLEQKGSIREYIKEFTELKLQIPNLGEEEALGAFMDGLKSWAQLELKRREVQSITKAISVAESLVDFSRADLKSKGSGSKDRDADRKDDENDSGRGRSELRDRGKERWGEGSFRNQSYRGYRPQNNYNQRPQNNYAQEFAHPPPDPCRICNGAHWTQQCPKKNNGKTLYSVVVKDKGGEEQKEKEEETKVARLGGVARLNTIRAQSPPKKAPGPSTLNFVEVKVCGKTLTALVDTGATNLFISSEAAKWLGLRVEPTDHFYKPINTSDKLANGIARGVNIQVGGWRGKLDFEVIPLDDYDLMLGMDFFDNAQAMVDLRTKTIIITDPEGASVIPMIKGMKEPKRINTIRLVEKKKEVEMPPKSSEKTKEEWELPTKTKDTLPINVLFPELEDIDATNTKKESLMTHTAVEVPKKNQVLKPKKKRSRGQKKKNKNKLVIQEKDADGQKKKNSAAEKKNPESRAPRTALKLVGENDTGRGFQAPKVPHMAQDLLCLGSLGFV